MVTLSSVATGTDGLSPPARRRRRRAAVELTLRAGGAGRGGGARAFRLLSCAAPSPGCSMMIIPSACSARCARACRRRDRDGRRWQRDPAGEALRIAMHEPITPRTLDPVVHRGRRIAGRGGAGRDVVAADRDQRGASRHSWRGAVPRRRFRGRVDPMPRAVRTSRRFRPMPPPNGGWTSTPRPPQLALRLARRRPASRYRRFYGEVRSPATARIAAATCSMTFANRWLPRHRTVTSFPAGIASPARVPRVSSRSRPTRSDQVRRARQPVRRTARAGAARVAGAREPGRGYPPAQWRVRSRCSW